MTARKPTKRQPRPVIHWPSTWSKFQRWVESSGEWCSTKAVRKKVEELVEAQLAERSERRGR